MTKWWHNGPVNGISVPVYSGDGAVLHAATTDSADEFCRVLNGLEQRVELLTERIEAGGLARRIDDMNKKCTCHERDSSFVCSYCYAQGHRGHMQP